MVMGLPSAVTAANSQAEKNPPVTIKIKSATKAIEPVHPASAMTTPIR
jgi:hypothetical protein